MTTLDQATPGADARLAAPPPVARVPAATRVRRPSRLASGLRATGRVVGRFLDVGMVAAAVIYLVAMAINGTTAHLGLGLLEPILGALIPAVGLGIGIGAVFVVRRVIGRLAGFLGRRVGSRAPARLAGVAGRIQRAAGSVPTLTLGLVLSFIVMTVAIPSDGVATALKLHSAFLPLLLAGSVAAGLAGAALPALRRPPDAGHPRAVRAGGLLAIGAATLLVASTAAVVVSPGDAAGVLPPDPLYAGATVAIDAPDPAAPGLYRVLTTSYGSGSDRHRAAFADGVAIRTTPVDASAALAGHPGIAGDAFRWFWGFGMEALPRNALVWHPDGEGPFPLVLIVHGNHNMGEFSEPGYAYLGEALASHGMIAASIDENFLNGGVFGEFDGREMPVRAWLLLRHLELWRDWNADPASPFHGRIDLDRVGLVGHSRGGEAAAVAAAFSEVDSSPLGGLEPWPSGLSVRAVVAIAPSDSIYSGGRTTTTVDFLTITGGHDADASAWSGIRQFARTRVRSDDGFKAAVWVERANHGQFNSVWGSSDVGPQGAWMVNRAALLRAEDQERVAKVFIGGFLGASLQGVDAYRALFRRPAAGRDWLPSDVYVVRSVDASLGTLLDPDALGGPLVRGVSDEAEGMRIRSVGLMLRALQPGQDNRVHALRWEAGPGSATYRLLLEPDLTAGLAPDARLSFALGNGTPDAGTAPLDPVVALTTADGVRVALPLRTWGALPPPIAVEPMRWPALSRSLMVGPELRTPIERVLQTYAIPLAEFAVADPRFDPTRITTIEFAFDRSVAGSAYLDEVGFARP